MRIFFIFNPLYCGKLSTYSSQTLFVEYSAFMHSLNTLFTRVYYIILSLGESIMTTLTNEAVFCLPAKRYTAKDVKDLRERLGKTQKQFSEDYGIPIATLRAWEQGINVPEQLATSYLKVIDRSPELIAN
jgi:DNA-binding transcriptional regulator YiaG